MMLVNIKANSVGGVCSSGADCTSLNCQTGYCTGTFKFDDFSVE